MINMLMNPTLTTGRVSGATTVLDAIGNTPLLDLTDFARSHGVADGVQLYAKAEWCNPGGSVKSRAARAIVEAAEQSGKLTPDKILIDSSSGNTAIAYALLGAIKGYQVHLVMPANVSAERKALVKAYGATLIESDPLEGSDGAIAKYAPSSLKIPNATSTPISTTTRPTGRRTTAPPAPKFGIRATAASPILWPVWGRPVPSPASGATWKEQNLHIELVAVQPEDELSVIEGLKHLETAIVPGIYDADLVDHHLPVGPEAAWNVTRALAQEAGLLSASAAAPPSPPPSKSPKIWNTASSSPCCPTTAASM
ncbi:MAG: pyridoxal-phosphate dependent enzyme [Caldilineaceae bacterium]